MKVSFGVAQRPMVGETQCGDACVVVDGPPWLLGVVDGLGHGPHAQRAAEAFCTHVKANAHLPVGRLLHDAGKAMAATRGGAGALLRIEAQPARLTYASIGNIELRCEGPDRVQPISTAGILGRTARTPRVFEYALSGPQVIYVHTDGISRRFDTDRRQLPNPTRIAHDILNRFGKPHDDATIVVASIESISSAKATETKKQTEENEFGPHKIREEVDAVWCSTASVGFARRAGLSVTSAWQVGIAVSELAKNIARHAGAGTIRIVVRPAAGLEVVADDHGPGIADLDAALIDGYSGGRKYTLEEVERGGSSLGAGLGAVCRLMDEVEFKNKDGGGLLVIARKRPGSPFR